MPEQLLIPVLAYPDVAEAVARLGETFGFVERWRVGDHRAQLQGGGPVENGDHVMVRVEDVDAHCATAREHGATILSEPAEMPYGERQYTARDHSGRSWVFTQTVADVAPEVWGGTSGPAA